jgi:hypothetical protein
MLKSAQKHVALRIDKFIYLIDESTGQAKVSIL